MGNYKLKVNSSSPNKGATSQTNITNQKYPKYEWNNIFISQLGKEFGKQKRMSLTCNGYTFQAKIDPNNYVNTQQKRNIQIPVINGIVIQDFGYEAEKIELKGSAGMDFYLKIQEMDAVFNNQAGTSSNLATLIFENRVYTCYIDSFTHRRSAREATYEYSINLTVTKRSGDYPNTPQNNSSIANSNKIKNSALSTTGTNIVQYLQYTGKTPSNYVSSNSSLIPKNQQANALQYIQSNWANAYQNVRAYPGDNSPLLNTEVLVVPSNWSNVLNGTIFSSSLGAGSQLSGDPTATA